MNDKNNQVELKACPTPWCNDGIGAIEHDSPETGLDFYAAECTICRVNTGYSQDKKKVVLMWNTRPEPDDLDRAYKQADNSVELHQAQERITELENEEGSES